MAMYFWTNYSGFNGEIVEKIVVMPRWDVYLVYQGVNILATVDLIYKIPPYLSQVAVSSLRIRHEFSNVALWRHRLR